jgi:hypothetical protein
MNDLLVVLAPRIDHSRVVQMCIETNMLEFISEYITSTSQAKSKDEPLDSCVKMENAAISENAR